MNDIFVPMFVLFGKLAGKIEEWLFVILVLLSLIVTVSPSDGVRVNRCYKKDPDKTTFKLDDGRVCDLCKPGHYMTQSCTATMVTSCLPCEEGLYMPHSNNCPECWVCSQPCTRRNQLVLQECNGTHNRVCGCVDGTYPNLVNDRCVRYSCPPGERVSLRAVYGTDVRCRPCARNSFSGTVNHRTTCTPRTDCYARDQLYSFQGNSTHNSVCKDIPPIDAAVSPLTPSTTANGVSVIDGDTSSHGGVSVNDGSMSTLHASASVDDDEFTIDDAPVIDGDASTLDGSSYPLILPNGVSTGYGQNIMYTNSDNNSGRDVTSKPTSTHNGLPASPTPDGTELVTTPLSEPELKKLVPATATSPIKDEFEENSPRNVVTIDVHKDSDSDEHTEQDFISVTDQPLFSSTPSPNRIITKNAGSSSLHPAYVVLIVFVCAVAFVIAVLLFKFRDNVHTPCSKKKYGIPQSQKRKLQIGCCTVTMTNSDSELEMESHYRRRSTGRKTLCKALLTRRITLLDGVTAEEVLQDISHRVRKRYWKKFLRKKPCPGLTDAQIEGVEYRCNRDDLSEVVYQCLRIWRNQCGQNPQMKDLLLSLEYYDSDLANNILQTHCKIEEIPNL